MHHLILDGVLLGQKLRIKLFVDVHFNLVLTVLTILLITTNQLWEKRLLSPLLSLEVMSVLHGRPLHHRILKHGSWWRLNLLVGCVLGLLHLLLMLKLVKMILDVLRGVLVAKNYFFTGIQIIWNKWTWLKHLLKFINFFVITFDEELILKFLQPVALLDSLEYFLGKK